MLTTPFHDRESPLCFACKGGPAYWTGWDPYIIPDRYDDYEVEYLAVREKAGAIDMSALWKAEITGPDATSFLNYAAPRDLTRMSVGQIWWSPLCSERGKVAGDGPFIRRGDERYWFSSMPMDGWFRSLAEGFDIEIKDITEEYGILCLQGPSSRDVPNAATGVDWADLAFMRMRTALIGDAELVVMRTGFTGELGFELWVPRESAVSTWDKLFDVGAAFGLKPAGHSANNMLRVEAGLLVPAVDYTPDWTLDEGDHQHIRAAGGEPSSPWELDMGHTIRLEKQADFMGKSALIAEQERGGPACKQIGLELAARDVLEAYLKHGRAPVFNCQTRVWGPPLSVFHEDDCVGRASSVVWSPARRGLIGLASISKQHARAGEEVWIDWPVAEGASGRVAATVVELPFVKRRRSSN